MRASLTSDALGTGSRSVLCAVDTEGHDLLGDASYTLILPADVPALTGWSVVVYDPQTRSMLQVPGSPRPVLTSRDADLQQNPDGSTTLHFGPTAPIGGASNWIETVPGKTWFVGLQLHAPTKPWFDRSWEPGRPTRR